MKITRATEVEKRGWDTTLENVPLGETFEWYDSLTSSKLAKLKIRLDGRKFAYLATGSVHNITNLNSDAKVVLIKAEVKVME